MLIVFVFVNNHAKRAFFLFALQKSGHRRAQARNLVAKGDTLVAASIYGGTVIVSKF
jgi:hypothetical protein